MFTETFEFSFYRPDRPGWKQSNVAAILNDNWVVNLRKPGALPKDPDNYAWTCPESGTYQFRLQSIVSNLRDAQYIYNKRREKQMFNETEMEFINETSLKDLAAVRDKINSMVDQMARLGKHLSDLKVTEAKIASIVKGVEAYNEDRKTSNRCGC